MVHIVEFVLSSLILALYVLFVLRPFVAEVKMETRRMAELLSMLPVEVDVEGLVVKSLAYVGIKLSDKPLSE